MSRALALLCVVAAVVYACVPLTHERPKRGTAMAATVEPPMPEGTAPVIGELAIGRSTPVQLALTVRNTTKRTAELRFPDGQTHDFVVYDATGRERWRWSEGRMFTQALRTTPLERGEPVTFTAELTPLPAGDYVVVATLRSENHPLEVRQPLTVR